MLDTPVTAVMPKTKKMSAKRKSELFDKFVIRLSSFVNLRAVISHFDGDANDVGLIHSDFEEALTPFFELLTEEETTEVLRILLPKLMEEDLRVEKVTIKW